MTRSSILVIAFVQFNFASVAHSAAPPVAAGNDRPNAATIERPNVTAIAELFTFPSLAGHGRRSPNAVECVRIAQLAQLTGVSLEQFKHSLEQILNKQIRPDRPEKFGIADALAIFEWAQLKGSDPVVEADKVIQVLRSHLTTSPRLKDSTATHGISLTDALRMEKVSTGMVTLTSGRP